MIRREVISGIREHLKQKEITMLVGPRQVGKTTLMKLLQFELEEKGEKSYFLNLDVQTDFSLFDTQEKIINFLRKTIGERKSYIFIDEIQRLPNVGLFMKGIYDMELPYKFILSGSGSIELKEKIAESMAGRKRIFEINPVTYLEFVNYSTDYNFDGRLNDFFEINENESNRYLLDYLNYGGYPKVILAESEYEKREVISEIFDSYILKDIRNIIELNKPDQFTLLIKILASQGGNLINYASLSSTVNVSEITVKNYLWYLEQTFMIRLVHPFYRNYSKELTKMPVCYFVDIGMRNMLQNKFGSLELPADLGMIFENFIFQILKEKTKKLILPLKFWRTSDGAEVDFVLDKAVDSIPLEVKYGELKNPALSRSYKNFITKYKPKTGIVVNKKMEAEIKIDKTTVKFVPYYKFLFEDFEKYA